ncbi:MAG: urease accessory protein UreF [Steroidobacteraceae bacterium]
MASQAIPIGGYSHSHGLEAAIESGLIRNEAELQRWITDVLLFSMGSYELPSLMDMGEAWLANDHEALSRLNRGFLATRESAELRAATVQMGFSMRALLAALPDLPDTLVRTLQMMEEPSLPCVWSGAAAAWSITAADSAAAYLWSWAENQVLVAMKSVPMGQSSGQRVLLNMGSQIARLAEHWPAPDDDTRSNFAPGLAILSARHETQYSRLFRS